MIHYIQNEIQIGLVNVQLSAGHGASYILRQLHATNVENMYVKYKHNIVEINQS